MARALLVLVSDDLKAKAIRWVQQAPAGTRLLFQAPKRTLPQNDKLWATLTEIAEQKTYHGVKLSADDWKLVFLDALRREVRMVPNLDGDGFVNLGRSSSDLSREEFAGLLEIITEWAVRNGVELKQ